MNKEMLNQLKDSVEKKLLDAKSDLNVINDLRVQLLGKKGLINSHLKELKNLDIEQRKEKAKIINQVKSEITSLINQKVDDISKENLVKKLQSERIDVSAPGDNFNFGSLHVNEVIMQFLKEVFTSIGFEISNAPLIDTDKNNFEDLNIPKNHPARAMQDTFYIDEHLLLRTHATNTTAQELKANDKSFKSVAIGKVFRRDSDDATHSHQFMQVDGVCVSKTTNISELIATLKFVVKTIFGDNLDTRIRPSYFPFTEPSMEFDVECSNCFKAGCYKCKNTGWVEILGCGMLHPNVLINGGYDPNEYKGFAFGIGLERVAILNYNIKDIRNMYSNDLRFNQQFSTFKGGK